MTDENDSDESDSDVCEGRKHLGGKTKQEKQKDRNVVFL